MTCKSCQKEMTTQEQNAYQGRCEDCWTDRDHTPIKPWQDMVLSMKIERKEENHDPV